LTDPNAVFEYFMIQDNTVWTEGLAAIIKNGSAELILNYINS